MRQGRRRRSCGKDTEERKPRGQQLFLIETATRRLLLISLDAFWNVDDGRLCPDMNGRPHHVLVEASQATRLDTQHLGRLALGDVIGMDQARPTVGTEIAHGAIVRVGPAVDANGTRMGRSDLKVGEDGRHAVR